ncbi:MAG: ABC transporter substrate-binding protein [Deltaproteobacteria bacterium]|jgi:iron(III) transport system substrate-binding protein|nr:ABC transporter substrate-binding protein [Deltaproteobacteria bacterium]
MKKLLTAILPAILVISMFVCGPLMAANESVIVYSALNEGDMVALQKKFKEDTGINLEYMVFSAGEGSARVLAEAKAPQADIFVGGSMEVYAPLKTAGALHQYRSPNAKDIAPEYSDPDGYWQGWYMGVQSIIYNRDRFKEEIAPKGLKPPEGPDDLINPAYKGLLVGSNPATAGGGYIFVANQIFTRGEKGAWDFITALNKNIDHYTKGAGDVISLVATGEFVASYAWAHDSYNSVKQGYPLEIVIPQNTAFEVGAVAVIEGAHNLQNAKIFMDWLLTKEIGQINTDLSNRYSLRSDVSPPKGLPKVEDIKVSDYDRQKAAKMKDMVVKKFSQITGA